MLAKLLKYGIPKDFMLQIRKAAKLLKKSP